MNDDDNATALLPAGTCDAHVHFYDHRFGAAPSTALRPPDASVDDYARVREELGISRCVIVQPTTYGLDNRCQFDAARTLGPDARVVVVVDETATDAELDELESQGAVGARFHMLAGGALGWESLAPVSARIADRGWHVQLQLDGRFLPDHLDDLLDLPCGLVIDHIGRFMPPVEPEHPAFRALLTLVEHGTWVKLSAPYESDAATAPDFLAASNLARALVAERPERIVWATNWPHPGQPDPPTPNGIARLLHSWVPDAELRRTILVDNPCELYGFTPPPQKEREHGTS